MQVDGGIRASLKAAGNKAGTVEPTDDAPSIATQLWNDNWIVKRDTSVHEDDLEEYDGYVDVEVNSPIYNAPPDDDKDARKWKRVTRIMQKIQADWPSNRINKTCAYQVHVGLPTMYSLLDVKRLATMLWLAERRLLQLYGPHHREESGWYKPLSKQSRLALANPIEQSSPNPGERYNQSTLDKKRREDYMAGNYHTGTSKDEYETCIGAGSFGDRVLEIDPFETLN